MLTFASKFIIHMALLKLCSQCTRQRKNENGDEWFCPCICKKVSSDTEACEYLLLPFRHDEMWDNQEEIMIDI